MRECAKISFEVDGRLNGLDPLFYIHRSLNSLQRLQAFYYSELGQRDSFDILQLVLHYRNQCLNLSNESILGIAPAFRIIKNQSVGFLENDELATIFSTNLQVIDQISVGNEIMALFL